MGLLQRGNASRVSRTRYLCGPSAESSGGPVRRREEPPSPKGERDKGGEHLTAEYRVKTKDRGWTVDEWKLGVDGLGNHWLDCLVGCAVAASIQGASLLGPVEKPAARERMKLSELQRSRR